MTVEERVSQLEKKEATILQELEQIRRRFENLESWITTNIDGIKDNIKSQQPSRLFTRSAAPPATGKGNSISDKPDSVPQPTIIKASSNSIKFHEPENDFTIKEQALIQSKVPGPVVHPGASGGLAKLASGSASTANSSKTFQTPYPSKANKTLQITDPVKSNNKSLQIPDPVKCNNKPLFPEPSKAKPLQIQDPPKSKKTLQISDPPKTSNKPIQFPDPPKCKKTPETPEVALVSPRNIQLKGNNSKTKNSKAVVSPSFQSGQPRIPNKDSDVIRSDNSQGKLNKVHLPQPKVIKLAPSAGQSTPKIVAITSANPGESGRSEGDKMTLSTVNANQGDEPSKRGAIHAIHQKVVNSIDAVSSTTPIKSLQTAGTGNNFCKKCMLNFPTAASLATHKERIHSRFVCRYCPKKFNELQSVQQHEQAAHKVPKLLMNQRRVTIQRDSFNSKPAPVKFQSLPPSKEPTTVRAEDSGTKSWTVPPPQFPQANSVLNVDKNPSFLLANPKMETNAPRMDTNPWGGARKGKKKKSWNHPQGYHFDENSFASRSWFQAPPQGHSGFLQNQFRYGHHWQPLAQPLLFPCHVCWKQFLSREHLGMHLRSHCSGAGVNQGQRNRSVPATRVSPKGSRKRDLNENVAHSLGRQTSA